MDTENDLSVGDMVAFTNDYGVIFGPCEVLAFGNLCNSGRCVYIDSDSYWFPNRPRPTHHHERCGMTITYPPVAKAGG